MTRLSSNQRRTRRRGSRKPEQRPPGPNRDVVVLIWVAAGVAVLVTLLFYIGYYVGEVGK
jgi:hypothetical protein